MQGWSASGSVSGFSGCARLGVFGMQVFVLIFSYIVVYITIILYGGFVKIG